MINYNNKVLQSIKNYKGDWFHKQFHAYPLTICMVMEGCVQRGCKNLPWNLSVAVVFLKNEIADWYWNRVEQLSLRTKTIKAQVKDKNFIIKIDQDRRKVYKKFEAALLYFNKLDLRLLSDKELWIIYNKIIEPFAEAWGYGVISEPFLEESQDWLGKELKVEAEVKFGADWENKLRIVATPAEASFVNEEHKSLLNLAIKINQYTKGKKISLAEACKNKLLFKFLKKHTIKFYWIEDNYGVYKNYSMQTFFTRALKLAEKKPELQLSELKKKYITVLKQKKSLIKLLSRKAQNLIILADTLASGSDHRKTLVFRAAKAWFTLARELSRRHKISERLLLYTTNKELKDFLVNGKIDRKLIESRFDGCVMLCGKNNFETHNTKGLLLKQDYFESRIITSNQFTGRVASPGIARGRVRIVIKYNEIAQVKKGEILVTNNTTPDYVPAMRKAAAIITEQGGVTSHAALVSRELGVPCIIGTSIATKFLKTGDWVEVDANNGVVRKLN